MAHWRVQFLFCSASIIRRKCCALNGLQVPGSAFTYMERGSHVIPRHARLCLS
jgi:hypothetical protein